MFSTQETQRADAPGHRKRGLGTLIIVAFLMAVPFVFWAAVAWAIMFALS